MTEASAPRAAQPLLSVRGLSKRFPVSVDTKDEHQGWLRAVDFVDLDVYTGQTLGLVGESGSGKTTLARLILRLLPASAGSVRYLDLDVLAAAGPELRAFRRHVQIVFQDPASSLNPWWRVRDILSEGIAAGSARRSRPDSRIIELLEQVELPATSIDRYPHEFSGGERQRIAIARALAVNPTLIVLDEPVSALDTAVQSRILNLLTNLQEERGLAYLLISHDLSVVRHLAAHIAVMYAGKIIETAPNTTIFENPLHPYTQALLSAIPRLGPGRPPRIILPGEAQVPIDPPPACRFAQRCFRPINRCHHELPATQAAGDSSDHLLACFNPAPLNTPPPTTPAPPPEPRNAAQPLLPIQPRLAAKHIGRGRIIAARAGYALAILALASAIVFAGLTATPSRTNLSPAEAARLGLDKPVAAQYVLYVKNLLSGDPGSSITSGAKITTIIATAGVNTLKLGLSALILVYALAIPLGLLAAWWKDSTLDQTTRLITLLAMGIPNFFLALMLIQLFAVELNWLPVAGPGGLKHLALPAIVLALESLAINIRLMRSSALDEIQKDYVRTLKAKGLPPHRIAGIHILRNSLIPVIAFASAAIPLILGYTLIVEVIFRFQGLGYHLIQSILNRDYFLGTTLALLFMTVVLICSLAANATTRRLDPQTR